MTWQDFVLSVGQAFFALALVPAVFGLAKPPRSTGFVTGAILVLFSFTFATLNLAWSAVSSLLTGALWLWLWLQKRHTDIH